MKKAPFFLLRADFCAIGTTAEGGHGTRLFDKNDAARRKQENSFDPKGTDPYAVTDRKFL
jgi:hypothetical protein